MTKQDIHNQEEQQPNLEEEQEEEEQEQEEQEDQEEQWSEEQESKRKRRFKMTAKEQNQTKEKLKEKFGTDNIDDIDLDSIVYKRLEAKEVERSFDHVVGQLPEDKREAFANEFADLVEWKNVTPDNVNKYIKLAMYEVMPDESGAVEMAKAVATGRSVSAGKSSGNSSTKDVDYSMNFLKEQGII